MRIKSLHITGFKSLRDVTWEPGALNVVIGPNGSGKSNLLTALELLSASAQGRLAKFIQRLGGMWSLLWDGIANNATFHITALSEYLGVEKNVWASYFVGLARGGLMYDYFIKDESVELEVNNNKIFILQSNQSATGISDRHVDVLDVNNDMHNVKFQSNMESALCEASKSLMYSAFLKEINYFLENQLVFHVMNTTQTSELRIPPIARYEKRVESDGQNLVTVLHTLYTEDRQFKKDIHTAMQAAFGDDFEELVFPPAADQRVQLRIRWKSLKREQSLGDISDGTLRFLFLMTVLASPDPAPLIAIDEPETGLHPSMFPIIAEYAAQAAKKTQVVFTTHSPQFLDACGPFLPTVTVTGWKNGETTLKNLDGELLKQWLADYSLGKMFESGDLEALA